MPTVTPIGAPGEVVDALTALVREVERTQRAEDVAGFLSLFRRRRRLGDGRRQASDRARCDPRITQRALPGAFADGGSVTYDIDHVLFIAPDVVLTGVRQQYLAPDGSPTSAGCRATCGDDGAASGASSWARTRRPADLGRRPATYDHAVDFDWSPELLRASHRGRGGRRQGGRRRTACTTTPGSTATPASSRASSVVAAGWA